MITRAQIVAEARSWLRTPYMHQARNKGVGVDCVGLLIGVARNAGLCEPDADLNGYSRQPDGQLLGLCDAYMTRIAVADIQAGDVIATHYGMDPCHLAFIGDHPQGLSMIHALCRADGRGLVVEHRLDETNRARIVAAYALKGLG
jgi:cell wall-associated NlpC family hydrolase